MKKPPLERKWFGIWHRHSWGQWRVVRYSYHPSMLGLPGGRLVPDTTITKYGKRRERKCLTCQLKQWERLYE